MPEPADRHDAQSIKQHWDQAAEGFADLQNTGADYYRYDFFGPAQVELCGDVRGEHVLDLGSGAGYFSREMANGGATVTAIDIAPRMVAQAQANPDPATALITYLVGDAQTIGEQFASASFDLITSCVSLHDMPEPRAVIAQAYQLLRPGGRLVYSITHPVTDTPFRQWERDASGRKLALKIADYFARGPLQFHWRWGKDRQSSFTTTGLHVPLADWINWTIDAGFVLRRVAEPAPTAEALRNEPDLADASLVPYFFLVDAAKPA